MEVQVVIKYKQKDIGDEEEWFFDPTYYQLKFHFRAVLPIFPCGSTTKICGTSIMVMIVKRGRKVVNIAAVLYD